MIFFVNSTSVIYDHPFFFLFKKKKDWYALEIPGESPFCDCSKACFRFLFFELNWSCFFFSCAIPNCQILDQRMQVSLIVLTSTLVSCLKAPSSSSPIGELSGEEDPIQKKEEKPTYLFAGSKISPDPLSEVKLLLCSQVSSGYDPSSRAVHELLSPTEVRSFFLLLCCSSNLY